MQRIRDVVPIYNPYGLQVLENDSAAGMDFTAIRHGMRLAWLFNVDALHLQGFLKSEAEQIFNITRAIDHLSWSEETTFVPVFPLPFTPRSLQLSLNVAANHDWHRSDRGLQSFLLANSNVNLKELWLSIRFRDHCRMKFPEADEDILDVYFPRASKMCKKRVISFRALL